MPSGDRYRPNPSQFHEIILSGVGNGSLKRDNFEGGYREGGEMDRFMDHHLFDIQLHIRIHIARCGILWYAYDVISDWSGE